jgi:hypothetical protein
MLANGLQRGFHAGRKTRLQLGGLLSDWKHAFYGGRTAGFTSGLAPEVQQHGAAVGATGAVTSSGGHELLETVGEVQADGHNHVLFGVMEWPYGKLGVEILFGGHLVRAA